MGVRDFLSVALAAAKSSLSPFFLELAPYVYVDDQNAKKMTKIELFGHFSEGFHQFFRFFFCFFALF